MESGTTSGWTARTYSSGEKWRNRSIVTPETTSPGKPEPAVHIELDLFGTEPGQSSAIIRVSPSGSLAAAGGAFGAARMSAHERLQEIVLREIRSAFDATR